MRGKMRFLKWCSNGLPGGVSGYSSPGLALIFGCAVGLFQQANAQIMLKPAGRDALPLRAHTVKADVTIDGQYALTETQTTFQNETSERIEADFIYTVPPHAVVTYFAYWYGREKVVARVVEKKRAAKIYDYITTRQRDPALIEMVGKDTFRARIFPIMPNADLKIEMHLVQVLPSDANGASFVFPLRPKQKGTGTLDSLDVNVRVLPDAQILRIANNLNLPGTQDKNGYHLRLQQLNYRATQDWRIGLIKQKIPLQVSAYAAPSGGSDGFFALTMTPAVALTRPSLQLKGVSTYDVLPARLPALKAGQSFTIAGRYRRSGTVHITLSGATKLGRWSATNSVEFNAQRQDNNLATKLWAARRIAQMSGSERHRATVIALSQRFTLPSKFTSWLAIPQEERERYHSEKARADLDVVGVRWMELVARGRGKTRQAQLLKAQFQAICRREDLSYSEEKQQLDWRWASIRLSESANQLTQEIAAGRGRSRKAQSLRRTMKWLANQSQGSAEGALDEIISNRMSNLSKEIIDRTYGSKPDLKRARMLRQQFNRLAAASRQKPEQWLQNVRADWAREQLQILAESWAAEKFSEQPDKKQMTSLQREMARLNKLSTENLKSTLEYAEGSVKSRHLYAATRRWLSETHQPRPNEKRLAEIRSELNRWLKINSTKLENAIDSVKLEWARDEMNRILPEITGELEKDSPNQQRVQELLSQHKAIFKEFFNWDGYNLPDSVANKAESASSLQTQIAQAQKAGKSNDVKNLRAQLSDVLDDLDQQQMQFSYGGSGGAGDPLIYVAAPADAAQVIAILPGGEIKRLVFNAAAGRWEARFDIPTYVEDGNFPIHILVVFKDGRRQNLVMNFNVDNTPPSGKGTAQFTRTPQPTVQLAADVSPQTVRVTALLPWGDKVDLQPSTLRKNYFLSNIPLPPNWTKQKFAVTYIITDSAHNRTTITVDMEE